MNVMLTNAMEDPNNNGILSFQCDWFASYGIILFRL